MWDIPCAVHVLKPVAFTMREDREVMAEARRQGILCHLDGTIFATFFATYVVGMWHQLAASPAVWAHGTSTPLTMCIMHVVTTCIVFV